MAQVANCPYCDHEFSTPDGADDAARLHCPSCGASFSSPHVRAEVSAADQGATIEFRSPISDRSDADADDLTLDAPIELPEPSATWDDSDRMQRLLAEIEVQPSDDYLPVARETRHSPDDETLEDTSNYEPAPEADADESTENSWTSGITEREADEISILPVSTSRRRQSSFLRTLVTTSVAGVIGLALGGYALLWILGPSGDLLKVAHYLPPAILPPSFADQTAQPSDDAIANAPAGDTDELPGNNPIPAAGSNQFAADAVKRRTPAEVPASYETPVAPPATGPRGSTGPRYATTATDPTATDARPTEPAPLIEQPVTPLMSAAAPAPQVKAAPSYTLDQLNAAIASAREAQAGLLAGDLNDRAVQRTKGHSYSKLCELAEAATFVADAQSRELGGVERLFRDTLAENRIRDEVARIVPIWIASANRRHGGIFFAGNLASRVERGSVIECQIAITSGAPLTILVPPALADRLTVSRGPLIVVGSLIDRPAERIAGYTGDAAQATWVSSLIRLDE